MRAVLWGVLVLGIALASRHAAAQQPDLDAGYAAYRALDLDRAGEIAGTVLAAAPTDEIRARALVLRALVAYQRLRSEDGGADLAEALRADPRVELPGYAPPAVQEAFSAQRVSAPHVAAPHRETEAPPPRPRTASRDATPTAARRTPHPHGSTPGPRRPLASRAWFWSALGTGASLVVAGVAYAWAVGTSDALESEPHEGQNLLDLQSSFETARTVSLVAGATGAVLLGLTVVLYLSDGVHAH